MKSIRAGVSRVNITPPVGMYLIGMERQESSYGLRDDLYATALAFDDGQTKAAVISMDVLLVHPEFVERVRREANRITGIPGENMMFCATHCHSGPVTHAHEDSNPMFKAYSENFAYLLIGLIRMAYDNMVPARFGFGSGRAHIGLNRRLTRPDGITVIAANPEGPVDEEVGVLRVDSEQGEPLAVLVNYACHPVVLGNGSNVISADWPGAMRRTVESITGVKLLYIQGAAADINPWPGEPCDKEEVVERLGIEIGGEVLHTWASIEPRREVEIAAIQEKVWLPLLPVSQHEGVMPELVELGGAVEGLSYEQLQTWLEDFMPWSVELRGEGDQKEAAMEMQSIRIGETAIVSAAAEIFVTTGLEIKDRSPFPNTMFAAYTNGSLSYIPLPEDYPRGGYEVNEAYLGYRLPAPVAPEAAAIVEEHAADLLSKLS